MKCQSVYSERYTRHQPLVNEYWYLHTSQVFFLAVWQAMWLNWKSDQSQRASNSSTVNAPVLVNVSNCPRTFTRMEQGLLRGPQESCKCDMCLCGMVECEHSELDRYEPNHLLLAWHATNVVDR